MTFLNTVILFLGTFLHFQFSKCTTYPSQVLSTMKNQMSGNQKGGFILSWVCEGTSQNIQICFDVIHRVIFISALKLGLTALLDSI